MRTARLLLVWAALSMLFVSVPLEALEIRLHPSAVADDGECVRLSDVARLASNASGDQSELARLGKIVLYRFGAAERECALSYEGIREAIRAQYSGSFILIGSGLVVTRPVIRLSRSEMLAALQDHFKQRHPRAVFDVKPHTLPDAREYLGGSPPALALKVNFDGEIVSGGFSAELVVSRGGKELERFSFGGTIRIPGKVPVAARALERGQVLRESDVRYEEIADAGQEVFVSFDELAGRRALEDIPQGTRLAKEQFEKALLVRRGMRVAVIWRGAGVSIESEAIALDEGREGDVVRLRNPHSGKEFSARVGESLGKVYSNG